jgi:hypothetical protein
VICEHRHAHGGGGPVYNRRGGEVGSDQARQHPGAVAAAQRGPGRPRHPHRPQRLPPADHPHLHPHLLRVLPSGGQIDGDSVVRRGQRDHELGLEPQRDLVLVVAGRPVELDAEPEVPVAGGGRRGRLGRRGRGRRRGRGARRGGGRRGLALVVIVGVVAVVEGEVEDLGAALPAQAPRRHGGRARIKWRGSGTRPRGGGERGARGEAGEASRLHLRSFDPFWSGACGFFPVFRLEFYDLPRSVATYRAGFRAAA